MIKSEYCIRRGYNSNTTGTIDLHSISVRGSFCEIATGLTRASGKSSRMKKKTCRKLIGKSKENWVQKLNLLSIDDGKQIKLYRLQYLNRNPASESQNSKVVFLYPSHCQNTLYATLKFSDSCLKLCVFHDTIWSVVLWWVWFRQPFVSS